MKIKRVSYSDPTIAHGWRYWCPGCKWMHVLPTDRRAQANGHAWAFDGNEDAPTFSPSVNLPGVCHSFVRAGRIEFLPDCAHALAGQTVDMVDLEILGEDDW
jgi:hypothetical protein